MEATKPRANESSTLLNNNHSNGNSYNSLSVEKQAAIIANSSPDSESQSNNSSQNNNFHRSQSSNNPPPYYNQASIVSDSEWEECVVLRDGKRYPVAAHEKHITTAALLAILYFSVTGGPYGLEDGVRAGTAEGRGGVGWIFLLMLVTPVIFHLPIALLTSELASAMPQNGGYIIWVSRAFGNFWGYQEAWLAWMSTTFDTALYPFLIISYIQSAVKSFVGGGSWSSPMTLLAHTLVTVLTALIAVTGKQLSGTGSLIISILFMGPFFFLSFAGLSSIKFDRETFSPLLSFPTSELDRQHWGLMLSSILWVGAGWDSAGSVGNDVKKPRKTYPRAISLAMIAVTLTHLLPLFVAVLIDKQYSHYDAMNGFWVIIGELIGGKYLGYSIMFSSIIGNWHQFHVLFTSCSWSLYAIFLPGLLDVEGMTRIHAHYETPIYGIIVTCLLVTLCGLLTFDRLLQLTMAFNSLALLLQCFSLIHLRVTEPKMRRPYRITFSTPMLALFLASPILLSMTLLLTIEPLCQFIVIIGVSVGVVSYYVARWSENERRLNNAAAAESGRESGMGVHRGYESRGNERKIIDGKDSLNGEGEDAEHEYEASSAAPTQPEPINLAEVFADEEETNADIGFRTSALADALPDLMIPQSLTPIFASRSFGNTGTSQFSLPFHDEGHEAENDSDEEKKIRSLRSQRRGSIPNVNNRTLTILSLLPSTILTNNINDQDDDSSSPVRVPSPVILRSPKLDSTRIKISPAHKEP